MLEEFLKTVKGGLVNQLAGKAEVDQSKLDGVAQVVTDTFETGVKEKASSGKLDDIMGLLGKGGSSSPFASSLVNNTVGNLVTKLGLPKGVADSIGGIAIPFIISKFSEFTSSKGNSGEEGVKNIMGDLLKGGLKDNLLGGLGKKLGF